MFTPQNNAHFPGLSKSRGWRTQVRCCKWLRHLLVLGSGCSSATPGGCLLKTVSLEHSSSHSMKVNSTAHCAGCWDTAGRKGLTSYLSTWGSQSRGEGDRQSPSPFGTLGGVGRQAKTRQREERIGGVRKKTDSGSCPNVLSAPGDRVVVGKSLNWTGPLPDRPTENAPRQKFERQSGERACSQDPFTPVK